MRQSMNQNTRQHNEYINNCENLTFWKEDICDEKYKDMFPINIIPDIFPDGKDASGFKPLINYIFNRNEKTDWYVVFTKQVNNSIQAYCFQCNRMFFPQISYLFHLKVDCQSAIFHSYSFSTMIIQ